MILESMFATILVEKCKCNFYYLFVWAIYDDHSLLEHHESKFTDLMSLIFSLHTFTYGFLFLDNLI